MIERSKYWDDRTQDLVLQLEIAKTFGEVDQSKVVPTLVRLATGGATSEPALQRVAIGSLVRYDDDSIPKSLVGAFGSQISGEHGLRDTACRALASRPKWADGFAWLNSMHGDCP